MEAHLRRCLGAQMDQAKIVSRRGEVVTKVRVVDTVKKGTIFMSFHFMEANANVLTNPALDPICKIPAYKVCAVRVEKLAQKRTRLPLHKKESGRLEGQGW